MWLSYAVKSPVEDHRAQIIWKNLEEQRTVIGPDKDDISELTLRLAANYAPRYAYQDSIEWFYEDKSVILEIINSSRYEIGLSLLLRLNWQFDKETAIVSKYNSQLLKDKYKELYEAKRIKDREDEAAANAQLQLQYESDEIRARKEAIVKRFEDAKIRRTLRKK